MYLRKVHIENIRSIAELDWEIPDGQEAGWHVVIGDNGSGKSTFLRAVALALLGANDIKDIQALKVWQSWSDWLKRGADQGSVQVDWKTGYSEMGVNPPFKVQLQRGKENTELTVDPRPKEWESLVERTGRKLFSAAYGPFRRFTGGDQESQKLLVGNPSLAAHITIFNEKFALTEGLSWLKDLKFKQFEEDARQLSEKPAGNLLKRVATFINQEGFLPHHAHLTDITSNGVIFADGDGQQISVEELSDGYRSVLSMTFELIRLMSLVYTIDEIFSVDSSEIVAPGVVLIDEVDAHLHPTWQRSIGQWFCKHFPNIQFIVTTHSPLVCQAAEHGTVFRLPAPGSGEKAEMVTGTALNRLLYGDVLDAYGTELFGEDVGRSEAGQRKMQELAELNVKEVNLGLSRTERKQQQALRAILPTAAYTPELAVTNGKRKGKRK